MLTKLIWRPSDLDWVPRVDRAAVTVEMAVSTLAVVASARALPPPLTSVTPATPKGVVRLLTPSNEAPEIAEVISRPRALYSAR